MSRNRRANSDLAGFSKIQDLTRSVHNSKQTLTRTTRAASYVQTSKQAKSNMSQRCPKKYPEYPQKQLESHDMIQKTYKLMKYFYEEDKNGYYATMKIYLRQGWQKTKKIFIENLNKFVYIQQGMQTKTYPEIQQVIMKEWKKNPVLYNIRNIWFDTILKQNFNNIEQFRKHYQTFRDFIGQLAYLFFKNFFSTLQKKGIDDIIDRLTERTSHFIISNSSNWVKIYENIICPLLVKKIRNQNNIEEIQLDTYPLQTLQINTCAVDIKSNKFQMPQTVCYIKKFLKQQKLFEKIKLLHSYRESLQKQILEYQDQLIEKKILKKYKILDKDDFISVLIYCVVRGGISFDQLGCSIKSFHYLIGEEYPQILSKFHCSSYFADLEVVFQHLFNWSSNRKQKSKNLEEMILINLPQNNQQTIF